MHTSTLTLMILAAGVACQWLAWRIRLPAIVILIATGLVLGPISGVISFDLAQKEMSGMIGLGVAIILFEGGMDLKLGEFHRIRNGIGRLTILGTPLAWGLGTVAAHYIIPLSWPVACVLGAILVVTGPTVILPLLEQARLNKTAASLLKWEGIVNDPVGILLAVLVFQYFTVADSGLLNALTHLSIAIGLAALLGGAGGWLTGWLFRHGGASENSKAPILMVLVLGVYWLSNLAQHEAGLLSVTVMGLVIGNMKLIERNTLQRFKEHLTFVLLSVLFIVIPSQLSISDLELIDYRTILFIIAILLIVRPLSIGLATIGAPISREEKVLLAWIAPRGIVAAATAGIFGSALVEAGFPGAERLLPIVFLTIIVTVLVHSLTIAPLARYLGIAAKEANGLLIVGASPFSIMLAKALKNIDIGVLISDGAYNRLKAARMESIDIYYGEILSERAEETLEMLHLSYLLCATDNDFYNALICKSQGRHFGNHRTFQLAIHQEADLESDRLLLQQRGFAAFNGELTFELLNQKIIDGWTIKTTQLNEINNLAQMEKRHGERGKEWILLATITPKDVFRLYSSEQVFEPSNDWTLVFFSANNSNHLNA